MRIEHDINPTGVLVFRENFGPRFPAVAGSKNSTFLIWTKGMSKCGDEDNVGIVWMDDERADLAGIAQSDIFPVLSRIHRLVNAGAVGCVSANRGLAGADVDGVVIRRRHRNRADGGNVLLIEDRCPIRTAIQCFPYPASDRAKIPGVGFVAHAFDRQGASTAEWSDLPPLHSREK